MHEILCEFKNIFFQFQRFFKSFNLTNLSLRRIFCNLWTWSPEIRLDSFARVSAFVLTRKISDSFVGICVNRKHCYTHKNEYNEHVLLPKGRGYTK